jgi:nitrate reductase alpha subunit
MTTDPKLSFHHHHDEVARVSSPNFTEENGRITKHRIPAKNLKNKQGNILIVTTVYDLMMAHEGVNRHELGYLPFYFATDQ